MSDHAVAGWREAPWFDAAERTALAPKY